MRKAERGKGIPKKTLANRAHHSANEPAGRRYEMTFFRFCSVQ